MGGFEVLVDPVGKLPVGLEGFFQRPEHQRERRAEFVANVAEKQGFRAVDFPQGFGAAALLLEGPDVGDAGARPAVESARASLAGFDAKRAELLELLLGPPGEIKRVAKEGWTTGWGEDGALSMKSL